MLSIAKGWLTAWTKRTPIRRAARQATWQGRVTSSDLMTNVKSLGMPTGLSISRQAPVADTLRTRQRFRRPDQMRSFRPDYNEADA